jgi:hypothetical protein
MTAQLPASYLQKYENFESNSYLVHLPPKVTLADCLRPVFWAHHRKLKKYDTIRVIAEDWSFDVRLTVVAKPEGGAHVQITPKLPADMEKAEVQYVPLRKNGKPAIRVEYTKAQKWGIIALDQSWLKANFETQDDAVAEMHKYVRDLNMVFPPDVSPIEQPDQIDSSAKTKAKAA